MTFVIVKVVSYTPVMKCKACTTKCYNLYSSYLLLQEASMLPQTIKY